MTYNLYTIDLLTLLVHKFIYAGNIRCATQAEIFADLECTLTADLAWLTQYCQQWRLKPKCFKDGCECLLLVQYQRQPPAEHSHDWPATSFRS